MEKTERKDEVGDPVSEMLSLLSIGTHFVIGEFLSIDFVLLWEDLLN